MAALTPDDFYKLATALAVVIGLYFTYYNNAHAAKRDTVDDLNRLIERLEKRIADLEQKDASNHDRIVELQRENIIFQKRIMEQDEWIRRLLIQLDENDITPVPSMRTDE